MMSTLSERPKKLGLMCQLRVLDICFFNFNSYEITRLDISAELYLPERTLTKSPTNKKLLTNDYTVVWKVDLCDSGSGCILGFLRLLLAM